MINVAEKKVQYFSNLKFKKNEKYLSKTEELKLVSTAEYAIEVVPSLTSVCLTVVLSVIFSQKPSMRKPPSCLCVFIHSLSTGGQHTLTCSLCRRQKFSCIMGRLKDKTAIWRTEITRTKLRWHFYFYWSLLASWSHSILFQFCSGLSSTKKCTDTSVWFCSSWWE